MLPVAVNPPTNPATIPDLPAIGDAMKAVNIGTIIENAVPPIPLIRQHRMPR